MSSESMAARTLRGAAETVFPSYRNISRRRKQLNTGVDILSDLKLQIVMYLNVYYVPCYSIGSLVMVLEKYDYVHEDFKFLPLVLLGVMTLLEVVRLYLGYLGNLQEKVPELAGFWLITCFSQVPMALYILLNNNFIVLPMEYALNIILVSLYTLEAFLCYFATRNMVRMQAHQFYLQHDPVYDIELDQIEKERVSWIDEKNNKKSS